MRPALVSGPTNRKKPYKPRFFGPYCILRILVFLHRFMAHALRTWAINRWKKHSVRNLQYGPKTRLIRGQCNPGSLINDLRKKMNLKMSKWQMLGSVFTTHNCSRNFMTCGYFCFISIVLCTDQFFLKRLPRFMRVSDKKNTLN